MAASYEIRVRGRLPAELLSAFPEMRPAVEPETTTVLTGDFLDQAALHGLLKRLEALGIELIEVRRSAGEPEPPAPPPNAPDGSSPHGDA